MERLRRKRTIIILIYLVLFVFVVFEINYLFFEKETCSDKIKNQNEEGVDCGGVCPEKCAEEMIAQDLIIEKTGVVPAGVAGKYDFYTQITNPNAVLGSRKFDYVVDFKNNDGSVIASRENSGFILPGERKYIIENNLDIPDAQTMADLKIINSDWIRIEDYYQKPDLRIINKTYSEVSGGTDFAEAKGLLKNNSPYDFGIIKIQVILKDDKGKILALNSTEMRTVKAGEERDFKVSWPDCFSGAVSNMETQSDVNIFDSDTFPKNLYRSYKFQKY